MQKFYGEMPAALVAEKGRANRGSERFTVALAVLTGPTDAIDRGIAHHA